MSTADTRAMMRDLALLLLVPAALLGGLLWWWRPWDNSAYIPKPPATVFSIVEGSWDWFDADSFCLANPHRIWFSPDRDSMYIYYARPWVDSTGKPDSGAVYHLQGQTPSTLRGFIVDETRRTETGNLVVWDLVLLSRDSYAWHRTDWPEGATTKLIRRCPATPLER